MAENRRLDVTQVLPDEHTEHRPWKDIMEQYKSDLHNDLPFPMRLAGGNDERMLCHFPQGDTINVVVETIRNGTRTDHRTLTSISDLGRYLEDGARENFWNPSRAWSPAADSFLFLVEDLSPKLIYLLGGYLSIKPQVFIQHISGGETTYHSSCKGGECDPACPGCEDQLTQWPLELDTELSSMSWRTAGTYSTDMHLSMSKIQDETDTPYEMVAWKRVAVPPATVWDGNPPEANQPNKLRLDCGIFRAYQAITEREVKDKSWGYTCAVEERATLCMPCEYFGL